MKAKKIIDYLEKLAPISLQEKWDNSGIQIGSVEKNIKNILLALDITEEVVDEAIRDNKDMIISHHPLFFSDLKNISKDTYKGRIIYKLINNDILVYSSHTNLDAANDGVNDYLAKILELKNIKPLNKVKEEKLYKIVVFVPESHSDIVRDVLNENGAGFIGNYSHCTFNINGLGTFMPREDSNPFIGEKGNLESVKETRIETIVKEYSLKNVINEMIKIHPYEEVAYDIYELKNTGEVFSIGKIGEINKETDLFNFGKMVKDQLKCDSIRVYGDLEKRINKVAVCGGEGSDFIVDSVNKGVDVLVTGDIKHHKAQLAHELGLSIIDATHYNTEKIILENLKNYLKTEFKDITIDISLNDNFASFVTI